MESSRLALILNSTNSSFFVVSLSACVPVHSFGA